MLKISSLRHLVRVTTLVALVATGGGHSWAANDEAVVKVGAGSYVTERPPGAKEPPRVFHRGPNLKGKIPSNDWWSSLLLSSNTFAHFPHPLALKVEKSGLRVAYPGANLTANQAAIFGVMPGGLDDFLIGHSARTNFPDFRVESASDWFVTVGFGEDAAGLTLSYGHGSPFVFGRSRGGPARLSFSKPPKIWAGDASAATLGISVNGRHYGLFAPTGGKWTGQGGPVLGIESARGYFSVAVLPEATPRMLALFQSYAHNHVTDTRVAWQYEPARARVTTSFSFQTARQEGEAGGTLFALYPHHWRNTTNTLLGPAYASVRGSMKLAAGEGFQTVMSFPGVLPVLPKVGSGQEARMDERLRLDFAQPPGTPGDTYWSGKQMGRLSSAIPIADVHGLASRAEELRQRLRLLLETWLSATDDNGVTKKRNLFCYDAAVGTLTGFPASYGSDTELNDHHFHYGYFLKAAAELARHDPSWAGEARFGGMLRLLIRDIVSPDREDHLFPFLRCFDPYAGHSWASGHARFGDGNNNESSSEALNAWCGIVLLAEALGDPRLLELGVYLFTTEMHAINEYWFNVSGDNFPASYPASVVTMVWGGKGANGTWFSADPQLVHGINFLPMHGGSLYLGLYPDYVRKNYGALVREFGSDQFKNWPDILWMYRALTDPEDAARLKAAADPMQKFEDGNTRANLSHWIESLTVLGQPLRTVTANHPISAVFQKGATRHYAAYNYRNEPLTVSFSDGQQLLVPGRNWGTASAQR